MHIDRRSLIVDALDHNRVFEVVVRTLYYLFQRANMAGTGGARNCRLIIKQSSSPVGYRAF